MGELTSSSPDDAQLTSVNGKPRCSPQQRCEIIDARELARRWSLPESWIREQTRSRASDPLPCIRFGRYVRFDFASPELKLWLERHRNRRRMR